ncbi:MAG: hypothetical protein NTZ83_00760 [Candidatus Pacearchaeota archaeon]|nr:hypothetical protein [Candidatus Pacearchaeota archaeon]
MKLQDKVKNFVRRYGFESILAVGLVSGILTLGKDTSNKIKLNNSDYIIKLEENPTSLYGFDDDKNGKMDRIEERGVVPNRVGLPIMKINKTYFPGDKGYQFYYDRLNSLGEKK